MRAPRILVAITTASVLATVARAELKPKYKERVKDGKPVQGPVRPPPTATPKPKYPTWGSLEEIAKLADEVRKKKGIYKVAAVPTLTPVPVPTVPPLPPGVTPTPTEVVPTPTAVPLFTEGTPAPEVIVDNGPLTDITLLKVTPDRNDAAPEELSQGGEASLRLQQQALGEDRVLPSPYAERFEEGVAAVAESRWPDALEAFRDVRKERPRFLAAWVMEIGTLVRIGKTDEAGDIAITFDRLFPEARGMSFVDRFQRPATGKPAEVPR
jgi:hypothetical protein